jgi:hypothetical protein
MDLPWTTLVSICDEVHVHALSMEVDVLVYKYVLE